MMKQEFERLAGYEVSTEDYYKIIEPMYMATDMNKEEFVKCIDKKRFALKTKAQILKEMRKIALHLAETCGQYTDYEAKEKLEKIAREFGKRFYGATGVDDWVWFEREYEYPLLGRGCTYPSALVVMINNQRVATIELVA